jgi:hypothetical protein
MSVRDKSIEELGAVPSTGLEEVVLALPAVSAQSRSLKELRIEDIRFLIGQSLGLEFLVPMALDHLEAHPLAAGRFLSWRLAEERHGGS